MIRKAWLASAACLSLSGAALSGAALAAPASAPVRTQSGLVAGTVADGVLSFKGLPFAAPPVGELRWRPPAPAPHWSGVRVADQYGHDCMQKPFGGDAAPLGATPAEDCLVLNVWRPAEPKTKLPVMVWIYGGGFVNGGASPAVYSGAPFAKQGVVFVSFNYRLGRLGFFAFPALTKEQAPGPVANYGYMDQIAALKWVKANIAAFGGDPDNVTVFGESAGGGSVNMLLTSPLGRGLFNKAIIESGGGRDNLMGPRLVSQDLPNVPSGETVGVNFARSVGIEGVGPEALARLRALPAERIGDLSMMDGFTAKGPPTSTGPMQDGQIVVESPQQAYLAGHQAKVPVMIGANRADIGFSFANTMDDVVGKFGPNRDKALAAYDPDKTGDVKVVGGKVAMDALMVEPARFVAATLADQGLATYEYRFAYVAKSMQDEWKTGAPHATEIPYVFDTVALKYADKLSPADEKVARAANTYWANFAKTGDPNGPGLPHWPRYSTARDELMEFTLQGAPVAEKDPWKARLDVAAAQAQAAARP